MELKRRLAARGTDGKEIIRRRLANARGEIREIIRYDYYVVNREVKQAAQVLSSIVEAERAKISRVTKWRIDPLRQEAVPKFMGKDGKINDLVEKSKLIIQPRTSIFCAKPTNFPPKVHQGQKRLSGEPYLIHPLAVASIIADLKLDVPSVVSGLLHDTVEDTLTTLDELKGLFGHEIGRARRRRHEIGSGQFQQPRRKAG